MKRPLQYRPRKLVSMPTRESLISRGESNGIVSIEGITTRANRAVTWQGLPLHGPFYPQNPTEFNLLTHLNVSTAGGALWTFDEASGNLISRAQTNGYVRKTAAAAWDTGVASSVETASGDCAVTRTVVDDISQFMIGLDPDDQDVTLGNTRFSLYRYTGSGNLEYWENGSPSSTGQTASVGDVIGVRRVGTAIEYTKNGATIATSAGTSAAPLRATVNMFSTLTEGILFFEIAGVDTTFTWQRVIGLALNADLAVSGAPTFGVTLGGRQGIRYEQLERHATAAFSFAPTQSVIFCGVTTLETLIDQQHIIGCFSLGTAYAMVYRQNTGGTGLAWRAVTGAVTVNILVATPPLNVPILYVAQIDRSGPTMRILYVQYGGEPVEGSASCAGLTAITETYGPGAYTYPAGSSVFHSWQAVLRGTQCEGSGVPRALAASLGWL